MSKVLWLDCDGVLLDWTRPFLKFIKHTHKYEDLTQYDLTGLFDNTDKMIAAIEEFNETEAYENLEPLISAEELSTLRHKGYRLRIITQCDSDYSRELRLGNLNQTFGRSMFDLILFTRRGESKAELLRRLYPYDTIEIVEDKPSFFTEALRIGGFKPMAIRHPYNIDELREVTQAATLVPIFSDMREVVRTLTA